jgi:hypothetical protein
MPVIQVQDEEFYDSVFDFSNSYPDVKAFVKDKWGCKIEDHQLTDQEIIEEYLQTKPEQYIILTVDCRGETYFRILKFKEGEGIGKKQ